VYHLSLSCVIYISVVPQQMDRLNSFTRVIFGRKQCMSRRIWQTIGPTGDLCCCPLNGFLRHHHTSIYVCIATSAIHSRTRGVTDLICMRRRPGTVYTERSIEYCRISFCCLLRVGALLQPRVTRGSRRRTIPSAGRGQVRTRTKGNIMLIQEKNTKRLALVCVAVMTNYAEDPKTVIGHSLQLKNATRLFFFTL